MIKYSIVIPVYNRPVLLEKTINSLSGLKNSEIIVIDDCSTKENSLIHKRISKKNCALYKRNTSNLGLSAARNIGVSLSSGKYIYFLDSDDILTKEFKEYLNNSWDEIKTKNILRFWYKYLGISGRNKTNSFNSKLRRNNMFYSSSASSFLISSSFYKTNNLEFKGRYLEDDIFLSDIYKIANYSEMFVPKIYSFYYRKEKQPSILQNTTKYSIFLKFMNEILREENWFSYVIFFKSTRSILLNNKNSGNFSKSDRKLIINDIINIWDKNKRMILTNVNLYFKTLFYYSIKKLKKEVEGI